jgi:hypothetical protein
MVKISRVLSLLYWLAKILSDLSAVKKGTVGKQIVRRLAGKASGRLLGRLIR